MAETFDLAIHLGPGVAQLNKSKGGQSTDNILGDEDSETGEVTARSKTR